MKRYRWLKAKWPVSMRVLAKRLKARSFEDGLSEGFVIDRVRDDYIEARFIERVEYDDKVTDPFGKELSFHRIEYKQCEFRASVDGPGLELIDAPRAVQAMISRLSEVTDFGLAISPLTIDTLVWARNLQRNLNITGMVDSLQVGSVELAPGIVAKMLVRGSSDVLVASKDLIEERRHVIEKVQLRLIGTHKATIVLSSSGTARIDADAATDILATVRKSLVQQLEKS
ncbi:hypothetical protein KOL96_03920 (plasmid) [Ralstonia wenshanensis]|uniref:hypothetical protein n=1 Tax=Ralstonia wenshanensis TaxID=2842456 RepID=UPI001E6201EC|nr:hypothetical protein [Ralstonia wenshanensis]UGS87938.1 hypothetical protein KOL96_03920 [Ralstonia wenshanensis]